MEWAKNKERQLALVIGTVEAPAGSLLSVECRQTICMASILYDQQQEMARLDDFSVLLERSTNMQILGQLEISREGDGASITVFLSR